MLLRQAKRNPESFFQELLMWDISSAILDLCNVVTFGSMYSQGKERGSVVHLTTFRHPKSLYISSLPIWDISIRHTSLPSRPPH